MGYEVQVSGMPEGSLDFLRQVMSHLEVLAALDPLPSSEQRVISINSSIDSQFDPSDVHYMVQDKAEGKDINHMESYGLDRIIGMKRYTWNQLEELKKSG
jgi:hypothetical protein